MRYLHGVFTDRYPDERRFQWYNDPIAAPPGGSMKYGKLEKMVEKYAKNMEVLISKLPDHVGAKSQSLYPHFMAPAFPSIHLCNFRQKPEVENPTWLPPKKEVEITFERKELPTRFQQRPPTF